MAITVIDALIVTLGLQPASFNKGRAQVSDGLKKTREEAGATGKDMEIFGKRAGDFFGKLRNEAVGLFLAFQGASSVTNFLTDLITGDAATGRLAKNIGMATQELSAWQLAVKTVGGDSKDADAALSQMADAFNSFKLTGITGHDPDFKGLGVAIGDLQNPAEALMKMAEAGERMDRSEFYARLTRIGIPPSVINLLAQGRAGLEKVITEKRRDGAASEENAQKAAELQQRIADLSAKFVSVLRPAIYKVVDALISALDWIDKHNAALPILLGLVVSLAAVAVAAAAPWLALGAAIAAAYLAYENWRNKDSSPDDAPHDHRMTFDEKTQVWTDEAGRTFNKDMSKQLSGPPQQTQAERLGAGAHHGGGAMIRSEAPGDWQKKKIDPAVASLYLRANGVPDEVARGISAGIVAEGGTLGMAQNGAFGLGQWRGDRQKALFAKYGNRPTQMQQLEFLLWELRGGDRGGAAVLGQQNAAGALQSYVQDFMRPGDGTVGDLERGFRFLGNARPGVAMGRPRAPLGGAGGSSSITNTVGVVNVYTAATDAEGIARELPGQLRRRGLTTQANRGME